MPKELELKRKHAHHHRTGYASLCSTCACRVPQFRSPSNATAIWKRLSEGTLWCRVATYLLLSSASIRRNRQSTSSSGGQCPTGMVMNQSHSIDRINFTNSCLYWLGMMKFSCKTLYHLFISRHTVKLIVSKSFKFAKSLLNGRPSNALPASQRNYLRGRRLPQVRRSDILLPHFVSNIFRLPDGQRHDRQSWIFGAASGELAAVGDE